MLQFVRSHLKFTLMVTLFFAPVAASIADQRLDDWLATNQRIEAPRQQLASADVAELLP